MIPVLRLASADQVPSLIEKTILPRQQFQTYKNFVPFPIRTNGCIPKQFSMTEQSLPRFSIFTTDSVSLNGFRLFGRGGQFFTDMSLTSAKVLAEEELFNHKLAQGYTENIDFAALGQQKTEKEIARDGSVLLACSDEPSNFGSWIYRILPKIVLSMRHVSFNSIMIYQQPWMTNLIRFLEFKGELIHHEPVRQYRVLQPVIPSLPVPYVYFRPEVRDALSAIHDLRDESASLGDRIYVSRRKQALKSPRLRALENETGLVAALDDLKFQEFIPENYSFAQQIAIFDKAKIIVGCGGSNMFGTIFARNAELILDIESGDEWSHAHANLLTSNKARWSMIKGSQLARGARPHMNWTIDIEAVIVGLRQLLS